MKQPLQLMLPVSKHDDGKEPSSRLLMDWCNQLRTLEYQMRDAGHQAPAETVAIAIKMLMGIP